MSRKICLTSSSLSMVEVPAFRVATS